jgi:RNA polymerase sporulation-specific sigma factor
MVLRASKKYKGNLSLNDPIGVDKEGNELTIMDMIADDKDVIEDVERGIVMEKLLEVTKSCLDQREYEIIKLRYGLEGVCMLTQREVADKFGISRSYISRIEKKAIEKIRDKIKKEELC